MGLDGGTIPTRGELVQVKKKPEQKDKHSDTHHKWNNCTITQLPLELPVVLCHLGMLFNKSSILEFLLGKLKLEKCLNFQHIESLKDVCELNLTLNRSSSKDSSSSDFVCPVTGLEMNGKHRFVCIWQCGCVVSERALKEVPSTACYKCGKQYITNDLVHINPNDADFEVLRERMAQRKALRKMASSSKCSKSEASEAQKQTDVNSSCAAFNSSHASTSSSVCIVTSKRKEDNSNNNEYLHNIKKSKKLKKSHKKHKKNKMHKHHKRDTDVKPQLHSGWSEILSRRSTHW
ncbi:RTFDC1 [Bugula neritina]|uniref:Replication termination factor 2 n=1 Tax=Bugula neritina TaxID=10212 RepID=A0A7J7JQW8_BUGNE|nr:RTFDC1 [Bugula neritina]